MAAPPEYSEKARVPSTYNGNLWQQQHNQQNQLPAQPNVQPPLQYQPPYVQQQQYGASQHQYTLPALQALPYQQHQTVMMNQPAQVVHVRQVPVSDNGNAPYSASQLQSTKVLGIILIVCGAVSIVSQSIIIGWSLPLCSGWSGDTIPKHGAGVWIGSLVLANGILSYLAALHNSKNLLIANMVTAIFSAIMYPTLMATSAANITAIRVSSSWFCDSPGVGITFNAFIQIAALMHFICAIWTSAVACSASCCRPVTGYVGPVQYNSSGGHVTMQPQMLLVQSHVPQLSQTHHSAVLPHQQQHTTVSTVLR